MPARHATKSHLSIAGFVAALTLGVAMFLAAAADAGKGTKKGKPRLSVASVEAPPATIEAGNSFSAKGVIANKGKAAHKGGGDLRFELRAGTGTTVVGTAPVPKVRAKKEAPFSADLTVPAALSASAANDPYSLHACLRKQGTKGAERCRIAKDKIAVTAPVTPPPPGPTFTPGTRTLDDPYFPQIGNGGYDALNYLIEIDYDPATNEFNDGTHTEVTMKATQNLSEFSFDFQRALDVSSVTIDGTPAASFEQVDATPEFAPGNDDVTQPAKLVITPAGGITDGSTVEVDVAYSGTPEAILDADESYEGWVRACQGGDFTGLCDGAFTVNEPIGVQSWFPANNYPTDKATIDTNTTVPITHVALGTGELDRRSANGDGTWTWNWSEDDPTAVFLATATVGLFDYSNNLSMTENLTGRNIPIYKAVDSARSAAAKTAFDTATASIPANMNYMADNFGSYPFDSTGAVVDVAPDVGYALENQTKPHYATGLTGSSAGFVLNTQIHEIAHQWFGNAVSPATWREIWFNEGWATFMPQAYQPGGENTSGLQTFFTNNYTNTSNPTRWNLPPAELGTASDTAPANLFSTFPVYTRPAMMITGYRLIVGQSTFYGWANDLLEDHMYGNISEEQFVESALEASGFSGSRLELLEDYFQEWLHLPGKPTITPSSFAI